MYHCNICCVIFFVLAKGPLRAWLRPDGVLADAASEDDSEESSYPVSDVKAVSSVDEFLCAIRACPYGHGTSVISVIVSTLFVQNAHVTCD
jgi:hypothetical protein